MVKIRALLLSLVVGSAAGAWQVTSIEGCGYNFKDTSVSFGMTLGCRPLGGQTVTIIGGFDDQPDGQQIAVSFYQSGITPPASMQCGSVIRHSAATLTCLTPPGKGQFWLPMVTNKLTQAVATISGAGTLPNATLSYLDGGLDLFKEGVGAFVDFMSYGTTGTFSTNSYMTSLTVGTGGGLDSNMWRVQGVNGAPGTACYALSQYPTGTSFPAGECSTFWGTGIAVPKRDGSGTYAMYSDARKLYSDTDMTKESFSSTSSFLGWSSHGGLTSFNVGGTKGGLGFVPYVRSTGKNDLSPGSIDLRLVNRMEQTITGLSVRYSLQCRNWFAASTTVKLQYTHYGGDDWFFNTVPNTTQTSNGACSTCYPASCTTASCWDSNAFVEAEVTGLVWRANQDFFLRWYISSNASVDTPSDPCRIADLEITPYVYEAGDYSLKLDGVDRAYVDIRSAQFTGNYTVELSVNPNSHAFPLTTSAMPRASTTSGVMTLVSSWDEETAGGTEFSWVMRADRTVALVRTLPTVLTIWSSSATIPRDRWTSIVLQYQYTSSTANRYLRIFIGGYLAEEKTLTPSDLTMPALGGRIRTKSTIRIGQRAQTVSTDPFIGLIDEVRIWSRIRTASEVYANQGSKIVGIADQLQVYLKMDSYNNKTTLNSKTGTFDVGAGEIEKGGAVAPLSTISASTLLSLTGGSISCPDTYMIPGGRVTCNFTVLTQFGEARPSFDRSDFQVRIIQGTGQIGGPDPDPSGIVWTFTYFAGTQTGTSLVQIYDKGNDPFSGSPARFTIIPEACRGCEYRQTIDGSKIYSCMVGGRRFLRKDIQAVAGGTCPVA